jgi:hypothetical protein
MVVIEGMVVVMKDCSEQSVPIHPKLQWHLFVFVQACNYVMGKNDES